MVENKYMAKSSLKMLKRALCLIFAFLLSIESFAAIIGDSDGGAFVTKQEFEELKRDFNKQLDNYNVSLDRKIDGAIASYINGLDIVKTAMIKPLVSNYREIKWKNDLFVKVNERKFSDYNTFTDSTTKWQVPTFGNYRIVRAGRFNFGELEFGDIMQESFEFNVNGGGVTFAADDNWFPSGEGVSRIGWHPRDIGVLCVACESQSRGSVLKCDNPLVREMQMSDAAYVGVMAGGNRMPAQITAATGDGLLEEVPGENELLRFKVRYHNVDADGNPTGVAITTNPFVLYRENTGYGFVGTSDVMAGGFANQVWPNANLGTFKTPLVATVWPNREQANEDKRLMGYMMLGSNSNTLVNCISELPNKKFSSYTSYDFEGSSMGSINSNLKLCYALNSTGRGASFYSVDESGNIKKSRLYLPLWPKYRLKDIYNPMFKFNDQPLQIGDGLPIAQNLLSGGVLEIKLKYKVKDSDLTATADPSQSIYISFKRTNFNDSGSNFYTDSNGIKLEDALWEPPEDGDTTYNVKIPVKAEDSMWLRLGPKTRTGSGLYAEISDLSVLYRNEY